MEIIIGIVIGLVVAGLALVAFARTTRDAQASPTLQDHWHQAYADGCHSVEERTEALGLPANLKRLLDE